MVSQPIHGQVMNAQEEKGIEVYPVRKQHKFGFVKFFNFGDEVIAESMIEPKYDYIGDVNLPWNTTTLDGGSAPFRLFELEQRVGLLNPYLQEIIPARYKRIRAVSHRYFAVEKDSLFHLLDHQKDSLLWSGKVFDDLCLADTLDNGFAYFFTKKGLYWGIYNITGKELVSAKYTDIQPAGTTGYYKVRAPASKGRWWLIDTLGRRLLKDPHEDVLALNEEMIAIQEKARWHLLAKNTVQKPTSFQAIGSPMERIEKVNHQLMVGVTLKPVTVEIWDILKKERIKWYDRVASVEEHPLSKEERMGRENTYFPWLFPLDSQHVVFCSEVNRLGYVDRVMDLKGNLVSEAYSAITPSGKKGVYKVNRFGNWGLVSPGAGGALLDCQYKRISDFNQQGYALLRNELTYGLVGMRGNRMDTLACVYDKISTLEGNDTVYVQLGNQMIVYQLDESVEFSPLGIFDNLSIVSRNTTSINEAQAIAKEHARAYRPNTGMQGTLLMEEENGQVLLKKQVDTASVGRRTRYKDVWEVPLPLHQKPPMIKETLSDQVVMFHQADASVAHPVGKLFYSSELRPIRFYDLSEQSYLPSPVIVGLRSFEKGAPYTPYITEDNQMGLIDRRGRECLLDGKPVRYTYIGPFVAGRARVCIGGQLSLIGPQQKEVPLPYKFSINSPAFFKGAFNIWLGEGAANQQQSSEGHIFALDHTASPCRWGYINEQGALVLEVEADYVEDFYPADSIAYILRVNQRKDAYGHPDADYGVINYQGEEILPTTYSQITNLKEYFLLTVDSTPTFFFTQRGHEIFINPTRLRPFSEGLAQFKDASGKWGYVDTSGQVVIPPQYLRSRPFSDGLALVADSTGACQYLDQTGQVAFITPFDVRQWRGLGDFHEDRAWFKGKGWSWGAYGRSGDLVIPTSVYYRIKADGLPGEDEAYPLPMDFWEGVASVMKYTEQGKKYATIIDKSGKPLIGQQSLAAIHPFEGEMVAVFSRKEGGPLGLISREGQIVLEPAYKQIGKFTDGVAIVQNMEGFWGLLNTDGKLLIPTRHYRLGSPAEGLVAARPFRQGGWKYLDYRGRTAIEGSFEQASPFSGGVAFVKSEGKSRIINRAGEEVRTKKGQPAFFSEGIFGIRNKEKDNQDFYADASGNNIYGRYFDEIYPFQLGVAKVRRVSEREGVKALLGAINRRGVMIVPPKYRMLHIQPDGNIIINPQRYHGLADKKGQILVEPLYDKIEAFSEPGIYRLERGEKIGYISLITGECRVLWPLSY